MAAALVDSMAALSLEVASPESDIVSVLFKVTGLEAFELEFYM